MLSTLRLENAYIVTVAKAELQRITHKKNEHLPSNNSEQRVAQSNRAEGTITV